MQETFNSIIEWHKETFPEATLEGQLAKYDEEEKEFGRAFYNEKESLMELADMIIVACGIMRFDFRLGLKYLVATIYTLGISPWDSKELWDAVERKMEINHNRVWDKTEEGSYHHV